MALTSLPSAYISQSFHLQTVRMNSPTSRRLECLEAARGVAAVTVVFYHVARHVEKMSGIAVWSVLFQFGHSGVDLFFVISGFIILHVHSGDVGQPHRLTHYINRRLTRIYPTYWVALAITIAMGALGGHGWPDGWKLFNSALLLPSNEEPLLGVAWTLVHEMVFYTVFTVLILNRLVGQLIFAMWLIFISLTNLGFLADWRIPSSLFSTYNIEFFMGMAVASAIQRGQHPPVSKLFSAGGILFIACALLENLRLVNGYSPWMRLPYGAAFSLLVAGCAVVRRGDVRQPSWMRVTASASFSIYIFQFIFIGLAWKILENLPIHDSWIPHAEFFLLCGVAIGGGVYASRFVEYALMEWVRRQLSGAKR
jgi:peptidoglycan/LPS O-acetylase OafA/YrhL